MFNSDDCALPHTKMGRKATLNNRFFIVEVKAASRSLNFGYDTAVSYTSKPVTKVN